MRETWNYRNANISRKIVDGKIIIMFIYNVAVAAIKLTYELCEFLMKKMEVIE